MAGRGFEMKIKYLLHLLNNTERKITQIIQPKRNRS